MARYSLEVRSIKETLMKRSALIATIAALFVFSAAFSRAADAAGKWATGCVSCHGKDGAGSRGGKRLGVKDLTDPAYQKSFTDEQAFTNIKAGEKDAGGKVKMRPMGDKFSDDEIKALVAYVRTLSK